MVKIPTLHSLYLAEDKKEDTLVKEKQIRALFIPPVPKNVVQTKMEESSFLLSWIKHQKWVTTAAAAAV